MFMHGGLGHIFMNMFMLWMFGPVMEAYWGSRKFFFYYIICGLGAGFCQELAQFGQFYIICNEQVPGFTFADTMMVVRANQGLLNLWTTVGASGALYGILLAYGMYFPNERMFVIPFPFPLKVKWVIAGSIALELFSAIATTNDGVAHLAHLGGMLFGYILIKYWRKHPFMDGNGFGKQGGGWQNTGRKRKNWGGFGKNWGGFDVLKGKKNAGETTRQETDWEYNAHKKATQEEIDRILDKIRKSGYDSLTKEEKQTLFDSSNN